MCQLHYFHWKSVWNSTKMHFIVSDYCLKMCWRNSFLIHLLFCALGLSIPFAFLWMLTCIRFACILHEEKKIKGFERLYLLIDLVFFQSLFLFIFHTRNVWMGHTDSHLYMNTMHESKSIVWTIFSFDHISIKKIYVLCYDYGFHCKKIWTIIIFKNEKEKIA